MAPKIIVGFDSTAGARDALALAERFAVAYAAELVVTCVVEETGWEEPLYHGEVHSEFGAALELAQKASALAREVPARPLVEAASSAAHGLHRAALQEGALLVAVGSTHRGRLGRITLGSTAQRLLPGAPCPVAIAPAGLRDRAGGRRPERIGIGYDGSAESRHALVAAEEMARRFGASLRVIAGVAPQFAPPATSMAMTPVSSEADNADRERRARELVDGTVAGLDPACRAEGHVELGRPAGVLIGQSGDLDLLVCGSRAYGRLHQVLVGSVSSAVIARAHCPVLVIPRGARTLGERSAERAEEKVA